jgi:hypothetical protein
MKKFLFLTLFLIAGISVFGQAIGDFGNITSTGTWSSLATWSLWDGSGFNTPATVLPDANSSVFIQASTSLTFDDTNATCKNLTIDGSFLTSKTIATTLTVYGNVLIEATGTYKTQTNTLPIPGNLKDSLVVYGNFTNQGTMDFRNGTNGSTLGTTNTTFAGSSNSTITMTAYTTTNNEFNAIYINKTGGANVICGSDVVQSAGNSTNIPARLTFISGKIITGDYAWILLSTVSADLIGADSTHYIVGTLGRGMSNSQGKTNNFAIGDTNAYRPFNIRSTTAGTASGHYVRISCIHADANTGSSVLTSDIDKVSNVRYFKLTYNYELAGAAPSMSFDRFAPSYGPDDGVASGNTNLRVSYSINNRANWIGLTQTTHSDTTSFTTQPKTIYSDSLAPANVIVLNANDGSAIYVALARVTGTTENSLEYTPTAVKDNSTKPLNFGLSQNYPNPFNPSTMIIYSIVQRSFVTLKIYDALGKEVTTLVNGEREQGSYQVNFNAGNLANGIYFYRLTAGNTTAVKKMILLK